MALCDADRVHASRRHSTARGPLSGPLQEMYGSVQWSEIAAACMLNLRETCKVHTGAVSLPYYWRGDIPGIIAVTQCFGMSQRAQHLQDVRFASAHLGGLR